jgi:hypothetical protein
MTRVSWWLVDIVARTLEPDERDAVRGDFAELGETGGQALRDLLGLVVRRQAALWVDWRPWLALVGFALPVAVLLTLGSTWLGRSYDLNLWIFRNYKDIDPKLLADIELTVRHGIVLLVSRSLLLVCWSWTSGFVLGSASRRTIWVNGSVFCFVLLLGALPIGSPNHQNYQYNVDGGLFPLTFYAVILPLMRLTFFVFLPAAWGMHQGRGLATRPLVQTILWAAAIVMALTARSWFWWPFRESWPMRLLLLEAYLPIWYIAAAAGWRSWRARRIAGC